MKIAILGTRGIPNYHGGFEQFAEHFSVHMANKGHDVFVYNSHNHPYQEKAFKGVNIVHQSDPENKVGTFGQFIYDLNCIKDARKRGLDVILQLGYTSSSIWGKLLPKKAVIVTNMDGLEWKRSKYSKPVRWFLKIAEKLAINTSDYLISDSVGIRSYIEEKYGSSSEFIPYGADLFTKPDLKIVKEYGLDSFGYDMLIARLEPENNIDVILEGVANSDGTKPFLVIGKHETKYGEYLKDKFSENKNIRFFGGIYNQNHLDNLRYFSNIYFHGHSVGGTNPSLLEAMASNAFIVANDNVFNKSILNDEAFYFKNSEDVAKLLQLKKDDYIELGSKNQDKIASLYSWDRINEHYENYLLNCFKEFNKGIS
ncbi:DUF1972 domain-containing protein [Flagellimonas pelagia]|uniref:Glycosyltransferase family 1 protein n=1 Tax=Flagellimonas pelagia TaxID=2306998 RepID=A0A3A1NH63_9FLAO|nr:DUF1972 domain-containing protein [Allomuricauda maritima]RIV44605.1 glycosyltransferase family 1 protein [Allomuricauda maritima]TXJ94670.1 glycosyltransferase family 1 protein [Allomuricauda maritima]